MLFMFMSDDFVILNKLKIHKIFWTSIYKKINFERCSPHKQKLSVVFNNFAEAKGLNRSKRLKTVPRKLSYKLSPLCLC